jgi:hypothetical protein
MEPCSWENVRTNWDGVPSNHVCLPRVPPRSCHFIFFAGKFLLMNCQGRKPTVQWQTANSVIWVCAYLGNAPINGTRNRKNDSFDHQIVPAGTLFSHQPQCDRKTRRKSMFSKLVWQITTPKSIGERLELVWVWNYFETKATKLKGKLSTKNGFLNRKTDERFKFIPVEVSYPTQARFSISHAWKHFRWFLVLSIAYGE